ncbi:YHS domain-containing (seleno)protein [Falsihalocynthiibacter sp. SS001]|uniref:YHS domain-containing (seleno)protein n=1 Tax=Falsihalocynthiibacter sp. SS001 TaxID=3349698 RepID=UPI0036D320ED
MFSRRKILAYGAALPWVATAARAGTDYVYNNGGVAISGYDPVAYFTEGKPVQGAMENALKWEGAMWVFASMANQETFMSNPHKYAPKYGGYCAYAVSQGAVAPTDPEAWTVHDGRLYLNYNTSVRDLWRQDIPGNVTLADGNWPKVLA